VAGHIENKKLIQKIVAYGSEIIYFIIGEYLIGHL